MLRHLRFLLGCGLARRMIFRTDDSLGSACHVIIHQVYSNDNTSTTSVC